MIRAVPETPGFPPARVPTWLVDTLIVLFVVAPGFLPLNDTGFFYSSAPVVAAAAALITVAAVLLRRRYPLPAMLGAVMASLVGLGAGGPPSVFIAGVLFTMFAVAKFTDRRRTLVVAGSTIVVMSVGSVLLFDTPWNDLRTALQITAFIGCAAAFGDAARSRRAMIVAIIERARRAEETKESEALRRVAEERLRIARDLHDLLAHQIAVINLHSSVASRALPDRPDDVERSLATIRQAARTVLSEIGSLLSVLRAADDGSAGSGALSAPVPGLADLDQLLAEFERSGLAVEVRREGTVLPTTEEIGTVAYRVIQEALTNAHKHGTDHTALLHLETTGEALAVTVTNTMTPGAARLPTGGHGLIGVAERVASVGGTLDAGAGPGPIYRLTATLPATPGGQHPPHRTTNETSPA